MNESEHTTESLSQVLVRTLKRIRTEPLPDAVILKAKCCLLDFLAACISAHRSQSVAAARGIVRQMGGSGSTLIGQKETGSLLGASLYNGIIAHAEELDDSHRYVSGLHLGAVAIPPALAVAEQQDLNGEAFMKAVVCGYEAAGRICRCIDQPHRARGFHSTGTIGPFGACAAAAAALNLKDAVSVNAIGLTGSTAAGLFAFLEDGATVKHLHPGRAAMDGLMCALLAEAGMTGPATVFEAREGFFHAYAGEYSAEPFHNSLEIYEIQNAYHKLHSSCGHSFPAIDLALALRCELDGQWRQIRQIQIRTYRAAAVLNKVVPTSVQEARFSIPYLVGLALVRGHICRTDFTSETLTDLDILDVAGRVIVVEDPELQASFPRLRAGILHAELASGESIHNRIDSPRGMPDNPINFDDIRQKFETESATALSQAERSAIINVIERLDTLASTRAFSRLLRF